MTNVRRWAGCAMVAMACGLGLQATEVRADGCGKSRDRILASAQDLARPPRTYQELYRHCLETLQMPNVKDAFVLAAGAIAVLPHDDGVAATAGTLARFCTRFPKQTLRFIGRREARLTKDVAQVVLLGTSQSTPCRTITGSGA